MRYLSLVQALRWKAKFGGEISRAVKSIRTAKQDYPTAKGRTAADLLSQIENVGAIRCYCEEGKQAAITAGADPEVPRYFLKGA